MSNLTAIAVFQNFYDYVDGNVVIPEGFIKVVGGKNNIPRKTFKVRPDNKNEYIPTIEEVCNGEYIKIKLAQQNIGANTKAAEDIRNKDENADKYVAKAMEIEEVEAEEITPDGKKVPAVCKAISTYADIVANSYNNKKEPQKQEKAPEEKTVAETAKEVINNLINGKRGNVIAPQKQIPPEPTVDKDTSLINGLVFKQNADFDGIEPIVVDNTTVKRLQSDIKEIVSILYENNEARDHFIKAINTKTNKGNLIAFATKLNQKVINCKKATRTNRNYEALAKNNIQLADAKYADVLTDIMIDRIIDIFTPNSISNNGLYNLINTRFLVMNRGDIWLNAKKIITIVDGPNVFVEVTIGANTLMLKFQLGADNVMYITHINNVAV